MRVIWLKYVFRFIKRNLLSAFLFTIVIMSVSAAFLTIYSLKPAIKSSLEEVEKLKYQNIDIEINLGTNYEQRFFSIRSLDKLLNELTYVPIFIVPIQLTNNQDALIYFVDYDEFAPLINGPIGTLSYQQVLVSSELNGVNNFISLYFQEKLIDLEILGQFNKKGIINDISLPIILMDKAYLSQIVSLPGLDNMANQVYISVKDKTKINSSIEKITETFPKQEVKLTKTILTKTHYQDNIFIMRLISFFTIIPLSLTLFLLAKVSFNKRKKELLILKAIGTPLSKVFILYFFEYLIYLLIGFIGSIPFWYKIVKQMVFYFINQKVFILPNYAFILVLGFLTSFIYLTVMFLIQFQAINKVSFRQSTSEHYQKKYWNISPKFMRIIFICLIVLALALLLINSKIINLSREYFLKGVLNIFLATILIGVMLLFFSIIILSIKKSSLFYKVEVNFITRNKLHFWLNLVIIFIGITMAISIHTLNRIDQNINESKDAFNFNVIINNITINHDKYENILASDEDIKWHEYGYFYQNITINNCEKKIPLVISVNPNNIQNILDVAIDDETLLRMNDFEKPAIILSSDIASIYFIKINDVVSINIYENSPPKNYQVAGFINQPLHLYAITNDYHGTNQTISEYNALYIKSTDVNFTKDRLGKRLSGELVSIAKTDSVFNFLKSYQATNKNLLSLFIITISMCLILTLVVIYSYVFIDKKEENGIIWVMGGESSFFHLIKKVLILYLLTGPLIIMGTYLIRDSFTLLLYYAKIYFYLGEIINIVLLVLLFLLFLIFIFFFTELILLKAKSKKLIYQNSN